MRTTALVFTCFSLTGKSHRVQAPEENLAALLASLSPSAGYQAPGAGLGHAVSNPSTTVRSNAPAQMMARKAPKKAAKKAGKKRGFDPESYPGVQNPTGFWDPWNFCGDGDEEVFLRRRAVEVKHGRVSMLACLGYIVPYLTRLPGSLTLDASVKFKDIPMGIKALSAIPPLGIAQIFLLAGALELGPWKNDPQFPGDFGWDPLGLTPEDPQEFLRKKNAELANGRLAMTGILGFLVGDVLHDGNPYVGTLFEGLSKGEAL